MEVLSEDVMETEFINAYILKQKNLIEELTNKWLMAEAKIVVLEKVNSDLSFKLDRKEQEDKNVKVSK